ncbi:hypothetical protein [Streptomyces daliensis]
MKLTALHRRLLADVIGPDGSTSQPPTPAPPASPSRSAAAKRG